MIREQDAYQETAVEFKCIVHDTEREPREEEQAVRSQEALMRGGKEEEEGKGRRGWGKKIEDASDVVPYILSRRVYQPRDAERPSSTNHRPWSLTYLG